MVIGTTCRGGFIFPLVMFSKERERVMIESEATGESKTSPPLSLGVRHVTTEESDLQRCVRFLSHISLSDWYVHRGFDIYLFPTPTRVFHNSPTPPPRQATAAVVAPSLLAAALAAGRSTWWRDPQHM